MHALPFIDRDNNDGAITGPASQDIDLRSIVRDNAFARGIITRNVAIINANIALPLPLCHFSFCHPSLLFSLFSYLFFLSFPLLFLSIPSHILPLLISLAAFLLRINYLIVPHLPSYLPFYHLLLPFFYFLFCSLSYFHSFNIFLSDSFLFLDTKEHLYSLIVLLFYDCLKTSLLLLILFVVALLNVYIGNFSKDIINFSLSIYFFESMYRKFALCSDMISVAGWSSKQIN